MAASLPRELERLDLPVNFSFGVTRDGRIFFIDDRIQATSWLHPLTGKPIQTGHKSVQGLPIGWEQAVTPEGAVYYIDHNGKGTTFEHPVTGRTANHVLPPPPTRSPPQSPVQSPTPKKSPNKQRHLKAPSASRDDSSMVTMRGWLYRQESGIKPWKKRWCVLADFCLFVYKDDKEHNSIGSILLPSYRIHQCTASDTHRKFAFKTEHDNMKTCLFASDNQDDMNRWINALKLAAMLKGPPLKEKEKNNNTTKLIPKSAFMEWEDVGTDALAKVGRAQQQQDQVQGQTPSPHPQRQGQPHYPPQNINQNPKSAFDPYQGRYPENTDRHLPQNDPMRGPPRNPHDGQNPDTSFEQDPRYRHPSGYDPRHNPQDRADPRHNDPYYDQGQPSTHDPHSRDPRHTHSDPRQQHPSGYDPRNHDTSYREQDGYDPRNQHPSGYHDGRNRDQSPQDPYHRGSRHDPQGRPVENDQYRYDPNESRRSDEMDSRYNPQSGSHDPRRSEIDPPYARANRSDPRKSEVEPPYARPHKSNNDPRQHHQKENGYIPGLDRESTLRSSIPDRESQSDRRYPQDRPNDQRYPEHDRRGPDNRGRTHSDDDPYIQMRPTDRDLKRDDQKRSSVQKLQDWQRQELERHKYGMPTKSDIVTPRSNDQSQNSEFYGYYSPKREAMERQRSNNLNDSRNSETFQKELHSDEPEDGYSTLTKYQTRDSLRPQNQPSQSSQPRSDNRSRSDSSSPKRNPDLMIDVGHTYVNFPRDPYEESRNEIPNRPPLPTAVRQQIVEELAQTKTPHTSKELIDAEMALEKRMQQPSYFEYPTPSEPNKSFLQGQQPDQHGYRYGDDRYNDTGGHHDSRQNYPEQNVSRSLFGQPPSSEVDRDLHMMDHQQDPYSDRRGDRYGDRQQNRYGGESQRNPYGDSRPRYGDNRRDKGKPKGLGTIHTVKEDPNMPDSDVIETEIPQLGNKYPALSGQRLRMSICASDLIGKTHDELVLMLIQLRREYTSLEKELFFYREKLEQRRPNEHQYRRMRQESDGPFSEAIEIEHRQYKDLKYQCEEVSKKLEVFRPIVNLVHNMVNMGSLYGGDNFMLASQYRKHLLSPDEITPPKKMLEFSRKHQEEQIVKGIKEDIRQLTSEEVDLEDKLERLYELDRLIQEQSFRVTSLQEDRDLLDKALQGILRQQDMHRDNPRELDRLIYQQRTIEKELSKVMHELAEASKELEETTAENNRIEHEVALLRSKVNDDLTRSKSAPSLSDENFRTKMMMEKDLAKVQNIMQGLNQQGARLSEAMNTLRRSSAGASLGAALSHDKMDYRQPKEKSTYMETDVDTSESKDLAQVTEILQSYQSQRSLASNEQREEPLSPTVTVGVSSKPVPSHRHQPPPHNMLDNELSTDAIEGDVQDGPWDIGDADDNTKRFFGIIPKEKPKLLTVRDVKRQAEQRKERDKLRRDDWNYDGENDQDEDQGYGTGGSSKYSDGNHPIYENLPPERKSSSWQSIQPLKNKTTSSQPRRPSLVHLVTPRPFVPFNSQNSGPSSLSNSSSTNLGYSSLLSPVSDDGIVKATRVIIQPAFASDNIDSDNSNERPDYTPKGWSPVKTGLFNVKRTPQGRYMTISSSEPVKLETSLIQPATLHTSAGDLIPGNTMDIPDIVKSSTTKMDQIDDATIEREILAVPEKVYIPERYMPDSDEDEDITEEERQIRQEKSEKIKRILTQQSVHSISQPDVSKVADQVHQQVQQEKIKRAHLLEVSQELARQVTIKSRQAAAERRKTWSGSPSKTSEDIMNQIIPDTDVPYNSYDHHDGPTISQNMYI